MSYSMSTDSISALGFCDEDVYFSGVSADTISLSGETIESVTYSDPDTAESVIYDGDGCES